MRLRAVELDQFRKFDHPVRVAGITDGLNLLAGPNEMGKSTLLAALSAVLLERHRSGAQSVRSLQPAGHEGTAPWVALDFERDGAPYRIEKRFLRRPLARLTLPDGRRIEGEQAEEQLHRLLSAAPGGRPAGGAGPGIWSLLWVGQGGSLALPELAEGARATLQASLDAEVGEIMGGAHGPAIRKAIEAARLELVDRRGHPRARYREVLAELAELDREIAGLERRRADLEQDLGQREDAERRLVELREDPAAAQQEAELTRVLVERDDRMRRAAERARTEAELERARHALALAERARDQRRALCAALIEAEAAGAAAETAFEEAARTRGDLERQRAESEAGLERLQGERAVALERLEALQRLRQALRQRDHARAALEAAATEVALALEEGAEGRVRLNDAPVEQREQTLKVVDRLVLEIAGIGQITVRPVIRERARMARDLAAAERQIGKELRQLDLGHPTAPARQLDLGLDGPGPAPRLGRRRGAAEPARWPDAGEADAALDRARVALEALDEPARRAGAERERLLPLCHGQHAAHGQAELRVAEARRRVQDLKGRLETARREIDDADLAAAVVARAQAMRAQETALERLGPDQVSEGLPALEERSAGLRAAVETRRQVLDELKIRIEGLRARVQVQAGEALDERLELAARRRHELEQERAKYARDARALELLLDVLDGAERAAKERYLEPVVARIQPYLEALFPGARLAVDKAFRITTIRRSPGRSEPFERLSDGTREQIAILARLAFAELLTDQGLPAVVILDDALVFSDDRRIVQMFEILERAARKLQIIVLTCREQLFEGLKATRLRLAPAPDVAASA